MLNRMTLPTQGSLRYRGREIGDIAPVQIRREAVMLSQTPVLFGGTVRDEALAGRVFASLPETDDRAIRDALDAVHLDKPLDDDPTSFSGGEKQRLCLARVLLINPPVLLLDEPTVGLDRETEELVFACIRDWRSDGRSVVAASHSTFTSMLGEADRLVFEQGRLVEEAGR
jgi:putative ABC transport system ATP-binding protein